jgi:16S rRNA (cytosine1402-N4)-methyltransferase
MPDSPDSPDAPDSPDVPVPGGAVASPVAAEKGTPKDAEARGHVPVLLEEVLAWLAPRPGSLICDGTLGLGGHAEAILTASAPDGRVVGLDRDAANLARARTRLSAYADRLIPIHTPFSRMAHELAARGLLPLDGCLLDLGVSSTQLDEAERGFSFQASGPLDMRMDRSRGETAAELIARADQEELAALIRELGEERFAGRVARRIVEARDAGKLGTTADLAEVVARAVPHRPGGKHPATRTFQALRMTVNDELGEIGRWLDGVADCLRPGGRICVITFHSLEDRLVKHRFRALADRNAPSPPKLKILTKHVVVPSDEECARNPRARSAKLRVVERL